MENRRSPEGIRHKERLSFRDQLIRVLQERAPDAFEFTAEDIGERESEVVVIEEGIRNSELEELLERYGITGVSIELDRTIARGDHGELEDGAEAGSEKVYTIDVSTHFSDERPPDGYAYKGGAARALLLRNLGVDPNYVPRDVDIVRLIDGEPYEGADDEVAAKFMPEDHSTGYGVEYEADVDRYFDTRDLTINEVLATDSKIWLTESCLRDSVRRVIRPTNFERFNFSEDGELGPKMLSKILRFYAESIHRWDEASIEGVEDWELEENFIRPFWLALQLDRAFDVNAAVAERFVDELRERGQIPDDIVDAQGAAEYLASTMSGDPFFYRHAPADQFKIEDDWFEEQLETLPGFRGHGRSRGDQ